MPYDRFGLINNWLFVRVARIIIFKSAWLPKPQSAFESIYNNRLLLTSLVIFFEEWQMKQSSRNPCAFIAIHPALSLPV